ncbi:MAG: hypothetical protein GX968_00300 [Tissierellia bacterium]|nr:hypothetical protein [Tissierellia bacterium]
MSRFVALLIALIPLILSKIFIASWVYKDAKSRGLDPHLWVVLILFFSGSLAFLLYILVIRDEKTITCENCNFTQSAKLSYCGRCGQEMEINRYSGEEHKGPNNLPLILGIIFLIMAFVIGTIFVITAIEPNGNNMSYSIVSMSSKYGDKWKDSFKYKNGEWSHNFKIDKKTTLNAAWDINDGYVEAKLYRDNEIIKEVNSKDNPNYNELIDLSQYKGEKVFLQVEFTKASGKIDFHLE